MNSYLIFHETLTLYSCNRNFFFCDQLLLIKGGNTNERESPGQRRQWRERLAMTCLKGINLRCVRGVEVSVIRSALALRAGRGTSPEYKTPLGIKPRWFSCKFSCDESSTHP